MSENVYFMTSSRATPRWLKSLVVTTRKLSEFGSLQPGWHYGGGVQISQNLIAKARTVAQNAISLGFPETNAFPGVDGGILITVYKGNSTFEIRLFPDGRVRFVKEVDDEDVAFLENVTLERAIELLEGEATALCLSGLSTLGTTMKSSNALEARPLSRLQTAEYPSLTQIALKPNRRLFVSTFSSSIGETPVTLQSSGSFTHMFSQQDSSSQISLIRKETHAT